jgi:iron complex outermembrane receptor protein
MATCRLHTTTAIALCALVSSKALAQGAPPSAAETTDDSGLEEIVVTAQKREQSLQDVPLSIAAVGGETLESRNITEISQLQTATPNFSYSGSNNPRGAGITIRGIGTTNFSSAIEGSVGIMIDGVVVGRQGGGFTDLFDIERIEILRGPQGTLVGKNASAGVLNIVTRNPTDEFEGRVQATYGEDNEFILRGSLSGPITDTLSVWASAYRSKRDGYITNVADGAKLNNRDEWGARGKLLFEPSDTFRFLLSGDYSERDAECCIWTTRIYGANAVIRNQQAAVGITARPDNRAVNLNGQVFIRQKVYGASAQMDYTFPQDITATSITAIRWWDAVDNNDADQTTLPILDINNGDSRQKQITQELRLTSPSRGPLQWVGGFFLFDQDYDLQNAQRGTFGQPLPPGVQLSRQIKVANKTLNYAMFGDATLYLSDHFNIFGGLRYTIEELETNFRRAPQPGTLPLGSVVNQTLERDDTAWTWRAGAQFRPVDDVTLYASVARGFKGGGFNALQDSPALRTVEPEIPMAYEIGAKTELFDRRLRLNVAAFHTDFEDFQVQAITTSATGTLVFDVVNAGKLRTQGIEADFSARFIEGLSIDGGLAYTNATYADFRNGPCFAGQTLAQGCIGTGATARQDLTGRRLSNAPEFSANISARYESPVAQALTGFGQIAYSYRGEAFTALDLDPRSVQEGYGLLDAQLGIRAEDDRFRIWVWGKNLTDKRFAESIFDTPLDPGGQSQFIPLTAQRQFGVTGEVRF